MASSRPRAGTPASGSNAVDRLLADLDHPLKPGIERLRRAILGVDPRIGEAVKWNAPSFLIDHHFATFKLHPPKAIQLVLHTDAVPKKPARTFALDDPHGLVKWAAPDRCVITLASVADARAHEADVVALVRSWIAQLQAG